MTAPVPMVEKVARAIALRRLSEVFKTEHAEARVDATWPCYVHEARASIEAIREPLSDALHEAITDEYFGISDVSNALDEIFDAALSDTDGT